MCNIHRNLRYVGGSGGIQYARHSPTHPPIFQLALRATGTLSKTQVDVEARRALEEAHVIEKQHSELSKQYQPNDPSIVSVRNDLRARYRQLLVEHVEFAARKGVDRLLWVVVFHKRIEYFRRKIRKASAAEDTEATKGSLKRAGAGLQQVLHEGRRFYEEMVVELQQKHQVDCWIGRVSPAQPLTSTGDLVARFLAVTKYYEIDAVQQKGELDDGEGLVWDGVRHPPPRRRRHHPHPHLPVTPPPPLTSHRQLMSSLRHKPLQLPFPSHPIVSYLIQSHPGTAAALPALCASFTLSLGDLAR